VDAGAKKEREKEAKLFQSSALWFFVVLGAALCVVF
jgi:hypothetical protein